MTLNNVVTLGKIPNNRQKDYPIIQAYNNIKDQNLVLIQLLTISPKYKFN